MRLAWLKSLLIWPVDIVLFMFWFHRAKAITWGMKEGQACDNYCKPNIKPSIVKRLFVANTTDSFAFLSKNLEVQYASIHVYCFVLLFIVFYHFYFYLYIWYNMMLLLMKRWKFYCKIERVMYNCNLYDKNIDKWKFWWENKNRQRI